MVFLDFWRCSYSTKCAKLSNLLWNTWKSRMCMSSKLVWSAYTKPWKRAVMYARCRCCICLWFFYLISELFRQRDTFYFPFYYCCLLREPIFIYLILFLKIGVIINNVAIHLTLKLHLRVKLRPDIWTIF
jgi:hypothetical protein